MRLQVSTAVTEHNAVFWLGTGCRLIGGYQHFRETYCLHLLDSDFNPKCGGSIFLQKVVTIYMTTQCHNPEDHTLKSQFLSAANADP
jgi:hypothetical protein